MRETSRGSSTSHVTIDDDPGRDLGEERLIGHRFFFTPEEVEPLGGELAPALPPKILVAGIGNVFLGDDGFGVAVAERLARRELPERVHVEDYGIRGMDLAYALHDYDVALFVDATPRGEAPGTLYVIEPDLDERRRRRSTRTAWTPSRCWRSPARSAAGCRACSSSAASRRRS